MPPFGDYLVSRKRLRSQKKLYLVNQIRDTIQSPRDKGFVENAKPLFYLKNFFKVVLKWISWFMFYYRRKAALR
jgi:hypothetical protein